VLHRLYGEPNLESFAWRSIWKVRQVLLYGCRWQIGDESKIKVMTDPWLRVDQGRWLRAPQNHSVYNLTVQQLMFPNTKLLEII
jgi:hypothetical protein